MSKEIIKMMKENLIACAQAQMGHLDQVDAKELGEVIDAIKDLGECLYWDAVVEAMEKHGENPREEFFRGGGERSYYGDRDRSYYGDRMYYPMRMYASGGGSSSSGSGGSSSGGGNGGSSSSGGGSRNYSEGNWQQARDWREGQSGMTRRRYMENKEHKRDKQTQLRELERYLNELASDVTEMIMDASPEEREYMANKIGSLAQKIGKNG